MERMAWTVGKNRRRSKLAPLDCLEHITHSRGLGDKSASFPVWHIIVTDNLSLRVNVASNGIDTSGRSQLLRRTPRQNHIRTIDIANLFGSVHDNTGIVDGVHVKIF